MSVNLDAAETLGLDLLQNGRPEPARFPPDVVNGEPEQPVPVPLADSRDLMVGLLIGSILRCHDTEPIDTSRGGAL